MPLLATLLLNFALGAVAALAAARELRATPRAAYRARAFRALAVHELAVAMPVAAYLLVRFADWSVSYVVDGGALPSAVVLGLVLLHGVLALAGFALAARLVSEHRARWVPGLAGSSVALAAVGAAVFHRRVGAVGTYVQHRAGFGLAPLGHTTLVGVGAALGAVWLLAVVHLVWSVRQPA